MFDRCVNCGAQVLWQGRRDENGAFCSWQCQNYYRHQSYCAHCLGETNAEDCGGTSTINAVGTRLVGVTDQCPECGSVVQTKCFCVGFPVIPLGKYRVLYITPTRFFSRKLARRMPRSAYAASPFGEPLTADLVEAIPASAPAKSSEAAVFRCPHCGSPSPATRKRRISPGGWVMFAVLLLFCFPLCWIGLLINEEYAICPTCRVRL